MKLHLIPTIALAISSSATASEIYFGRTTPSAVAEVHQVQPPQSSADGQILLESVLGVALSSLASESGDIRIVGAAISPTTASPAGFATYEQEALDDALLAIQGGGIDPARTPGAAEYRYGLGQNGQTALWNVQFEGVPDYDSNDRNFFREKLDEAIASARTAIRANPFRKGDGSGYAIIFQAAYEATVPYTFAGNEWRAKADRDRIGINPADASPTDRMAALQTAADRFLEAGDALLALLNHPVESAWLLDPDAVIVGVGPAWADGDSWADLLYESYAEAITRYADARFEYFYTRYLAEYQPPGSGNTAMQSLISDIENAAAEIDQLALPLAALATRGVLKPDIDVHGPGSRSNLLRRLAEHVQDRALFFTAGANPFANNRTAYRTYGPSFVPFLTPINLAERPFTFDNLLDFIYGISGTSIAPIGTTELPNSLIGIAIREEESASGLIDDVVTSTTELTNLWAETADNYEGQLEQLCGVRRSVPEDSGSDLVPDILGYLAPPEFRDPLGSGESYGEIGLSWGRIDQAETRLLAAYRRLDAIFEEAQIIEEYGEQRLRSYANIANIQIGAGKEISALDYLSGEYRAQAIKAAAEEQAKQAEKKNWYGAAGRILGSIGKAFTGNPLAAWDTLGDIGGLVDQHNNSKSTAEMHRKIGDIQANAARKQAEIDAQRTMVRAIEARDITLEQADQEEARIEEAIYRLMVNVENQKLEILLAEQAVAYAEMEHANLIARIGSLLEEYRRVSIRQAESVINRPDVRLVRDFQIQEAARKFRIAQEYAFLLARSADYRFAGGSGTNFRARIRSEVATILQAQNATQIKEAVDKLINIRGEFFGGVAANANLSGLEEVRFSIRDLIAQSNSRLAIFGRDDFGEEAVDPDNPFSGYFPGDLQPFPDSIDPSVAGDTARLSEAQFQDFINRRLFTVEGAPDERILRIPFAIGLEPTQGQRRNPIRNAAGNSLYGLVIEGPNPSYISSSAVGVFANVRLRRTVNPALFTNTASLTPIGSFSLTREAAPGETAALGSQSIDSWEVVEMGMQPKSAQVRILKNKDTLTEGWKSRFSAELSLDNVGSALHERSPVNNYWLLEIQMTADDWEDLDGNIMDIELCMTLRGWK